MTTIYGPNLFSNGDFTDWDDANTPTDWTHSTISVGVNETTEVAFGEFHGDTGNGAANIFCSDANIVFLNMSNQLTVGGMFQLEIDLAVNTAGISITNGATTTTYATLTTSGTHTVQFTAIVDDDLIIRNITGQNCDCDIDNVRVGIAIGSTEFVQIDRFGWAYNALATDATSGMNVVPAPGIGKNLVIKELHITTPIAESASVKTRASATATINPQLGSFPMNTGGYSDSYLGGLQMPENERIDVFTSTADQLQIFIAGETV